MKKKKLARCLKISLCLLLLFGVSAQAVFAAPVLWDDGSDDDGAAQNRAVFETLPESYIPQGIPDFETIPFEPTQTPYTAAERRALTSGAPWQGAMHWGKDLQQNVERREGPARDDVRDIVEGVLRVSTSGTYFPIEDCPLNGRLLSVCAGEEDELYLLTKDGQIWVTDTFGGNGKQVGSLPGIEGVFIDEWWVNTCTDGTVYWFVYGQQVARVYLPTGRVDVGALAEPCRIWQPLSRSKLYCQYLTANKDYMPMARFSFYQVPDSLREWPCVGADPDFLTPYNACTLQVRQTTYNLEKDSEAALAAGSVLQLQSSGYLNGDPRFNALAAAGRSYTEYFAKERAVRILNDEKEEVRSVPGMLYCQVADGSLQLMRESTYYGLIQLWDTNDCVIAVNSPLNGQLEKAHYTDGHMYLWTKDHRLYCADAHGRPIALVADFEYIMAAAQLPKIEYDIQFSGPLAWVTVNNRLFRIYLPGGEIDILDFAFPADATWWQPLTSTAVEYRCAGDTQWWVHHLDSNVSVRVDNGTGALKLPGIYGRPLESYLPYYVVQR